MLAEDLARGLSVPGWLWVVLRDGRPVARVGWWSRNGSRPEVLETLDLDDDAPDRIDTAARLLRTAMVAVLPSDVPRPHYVLEPVPVRWRDDPVAGRRIEERLKLVRRTGGRLFVERLRYEWVSGTPLPQPSGRLSFRQVRDDDDALTLLAAEGAERVTADTDVTNTPMARAFERAGYTNFAGRIDTSWD